MQKASGQRQQLKASNPHLEPGPGWGPGLEANRVEGPTQTCNLGVAFQRLQAGAAEGATASCEIPLPWGRLELGEKPAPFPFPFPLLPSPTSLPLQGRWEGRRRYRTTGGGGVGG